MTLVYHGRLPPGALVNHRAEGLWLHAEPGAFADADAPGRIFAWQAKAGEGVAVAVGPNKTGTLTAPGRAALRFESGEQGGLVLPGALADTARCSFGLIWHPAAADAETLLTLQPGDGGYLYLAAAGGTIRVERKGGGLDLRAAQPDGPVLVICGLSGGQVRLAVNDAPPAAAPAAMPPAPADLFIACRGQRAGLRGKLGAFALTDVFVWPGHDCLAAPGDPARAAALAQWRETRAL